MSTNLPTRAQIDAAGDIDFTQPRSASKDLHIRIELAPDGLHITVEYVGQLASIPAAIERLRAAGVLDLVAQNRPTSAQALPPLPDAPPTCPVHGVAMKAMEKPDKGGRRWWCTKKDGDGFCKQRA